MGRYRDEAEVCYCFGWGGELVVIHCEGLKGVQIFKDSKTAPYGVGQRDLKTSRLKWTLGEMFHRHSNAPFHFNHRASIFLHDIKAMLLYSVSMEDMSSLRAANHSKGVFWWQYLNSLLSKTIDQATSSEHRVATINPHAHMHLKADAMRSTASV